MKLEVEIKIFWKADIEKYDAEICCYDQGDLVVHQWTGNLDTMEEIYPIISLWSKGVK